MEAPQVPWFWYSLRRHQLVSMTGMTSTAQR